MYEYISGFCQKLKEIETDIFVVLFEFGLLLMVRISIPTQPSQNKDFVYTKMKVNQED